MTIKTVYRDSEDNVINIGDWDYMITYEEDENGSKIEIINNPLPENYSTKDEEIYILEDGGLSVGNKEEVA